MTSRPRLAACGALLLGGLVACAEPGAEWMDETISEPRVFAPGVISTSQREYGLTFSPDGREVYFTRRPRRGPARILRSRFTEGAWSDPVPASFAREGDEAPFLVPDGSMLLFSSRRAARGRWDRSANIWLVEREGAGWSEPRPLPGTVNRPGGEVDDFDVGMELGPFLHPEGILLYWTRRTPDWGSDIYVAERNEAGEFLDPRPLLLNSSGDESNPVLSPDGRHLVFQAYRGRNGYGDDDLYVAERTDFGWSSPRPLPAPVNSPASEGHPRFSPDGRLFFFSSDRDRRYDDIYVVSTSALGLDDTHSAEAGDR